MPEPAAFDGASLSLAWVAPFVGLLLSIAILPLFAPHFWHRRYGLIAAFWAFAFLVPFAARFGLGAAAHEALHTLLLEYIPFVVLIGGLYIVSGGLAIRGAPPATPARNTALLAFGAAMASLIGTTGAAMVLIRPLLRANAGRARAAHVVIFFIFLVANVGGGLSPLGDPPLFLGYLLGVSFFWPLLNLWPQTLLVAGLLLAAFYGLDRAIAKADGLPQETQDIQGTREGARRLSVHGLVNIPLLILFVGTVLASGAFQDAGSLRVVGVDLSVASLARDGALLIFAVLSWWLTAERHRLANGFSWHPALEIAKLFAAIFITIIPALAILRAGERGALSGLLTILDGAGPNDFAYFWLTGLLSAFLDNAPTYLVFFNAAGGDAATLMTSGARTLAAISTGAVFMGALTYIGNAPNMMVRAIAAEEGVRMPSFFGYLLWSGAVLLPVFALVSLLFY